MDSLDPGNDGPVSGLLFRGHTTSRLMTQKADASVFSSVLQGTVAWWLASAINGSPQSAHLQAALRGCRLEAEARITAKIKRGVRDGELPPRTNTAALGKFYMTVMQGMTIQARDGATQKELLAVARAAMLQWPKFPEDGLLPPVAVT